MPVAGNGCGMNDVAPFDNHEAAFGFSPLHGKAVAASCLATLRSPPRAMSECRFKFI